MKRIITISLAVMLIMTNLHSQVYHREYYSTPTTLKATSSAFVQLNQTLNPGISLLFKTDGHDIEILELDAATLAPLNTSYIYSGSISSLTIHFNNAFVDPIGDVIIYGYLLENNKKMGMALKYYPNQPTNNIKLFFMPNNITDAIVSGCFGYDLSDSLNYTFVNESGFVFATKSDFSLAHNGIIPKNGKFTHVTYDFLRNNYLLSGTYNDFTQLASLFAIVDGNLNSSSGVTYTYKHSPQFHSFADGRTMHKQIKDNYIVLCQDLRSGNDHVWLAKIDINNGTVSESEIIKMELTSIQFIDIDYYESKERLMILGRANYCNGAGKNFIIQENPNRMTYHYANNIDILFNTDFSYDYFLQGCDYVNDIFLSQIYFNKLNNMFFTSGVNTANVMHIYSNELSNINSAKNCNKIKKPFVTYLSYMPSHNVLYAKDIYNEKYLELSLTSQMMPDSSLFCYNSEYIPDFRRTNNFQPTPTIDILNNGTIAFSCNAMKGKCHYLVYNSLGQKVLEGNTFNGIINMLDLPSHGLYIIHVIDENGVRESNKIVY